MNSTFLWPRVLEEGNQLELALFGCWITGLIDDNVMFDFST